MVLKWFYTASFMIVCYDVKQGFRKGEAGGEFLLSHSSELAAYYFIIG